MPSLSGECSHAKLYVTCFVGDPVLGKCNIDSTDHSTSSAIRTATDSSDFVTNIEGPGPGSNEQSGVDVIILIIIAASVVGTFVLTLLITTTVMLIVIIRRNLCGCISHPDRYKHSHGRVHETESADISESALYSDLMDVPIAQSQQEIPIHEMIMTKSENTAQEVKSATNKCQLDIKENIAYEATSHITTQTNEAYGASTCPVDLKENIAYETSSNIKKITTQTNEAYGAFVH